MPADTDVLPEPQPAAPERSRGRAGALDAALAAAVEVALAAAIEVAEPATVGEHLGVEAEADRVVTHYFGCDSAGYRGWRWAVTLARAPRSRTVTVSEVHLLPGADAVLSPSWLPWADRIAPGDLSPGMVLPAVEDDVRLEQGFEATGDEDVDALAVFELGLGRPRVLSMEGRDAAAQRWYAGVHGPHDPFAEQAPAPCASCGFFVPMAGALRAVFGVCANEWSPSDGSVVSLDHGCGAHSEASPQVQAAAVDQPILDELGDIEFDVDSAPAIEGLFAEDVVVEDVVVEEVVVEDVVVEDVSADDLAADDWAADERAADDTAAAPVEDAPQP